LSEKLHLQDLAFLGLDSAAHPFHVGGLMLFTPPARAPSSYLHTLLGRLGEALPQLDPLFLRRLDPAHPASPRWITATDFRAQDHLLHYALPRPARSAELLELVSRAHERVLDRGRPLWECHLIEGLPRGRFALYCKIHHALIDGIGAQRLLMRLLSQAPRRGASRSGPSRTASPPRGGGQHGWREGLSETARLMLTQSRAVPELAAMLARTGREHREDTPPLPFTAPRAPMNGTISARRRIVVTDFGLTTLRRLGAAGGGTINDALLAICGGALRSYLAEHGILPRKSLLAGVPVSVKSPGAQQGNQLSTIVCPLETTTADPLRRLRRICRVTRRAKDEVRALSPAAREDYMNLVLLPAMVFSLAHRATAIPPPFNVIVSNVPGPRAPLYLDGARLDAIYPLSVVTDAQALNITAFGCARRACVAVTACPDELPGIERFDSHLRAAARELQQSIRN